jgi:Cys-tRNA(Pro)/Cys-tRNA(Cys) deacylase
MAKIHTHAIRALDELHVPYEVVMLAHKVRHLDDAADERGLPPSGLVKTLLARDAGSAVGARRYVIAIVRGDQRLSLKKLARLVGVKALEMAPLEDVPRITGYEPGAVSPAGLRRNDIPIYVDRHILDQPRISVSAGRHDAELELAPPDLVRAVHGQVADLTE